MLSMDSETVFTEANKSFEVALNVNISPLMEQASSLYLSFDWTNSL